MVKSQTNLVWSVSPDIGAKLPVSRLLLVSWPGEASRPWVGSGRMSASAVSIVCGRRNECSGACLRVFSATEWSVAAAKLASLLSGAGGTVRILGAIASRWAHGRRGSVRRTQRKYPLCEAGLLCFSNPRSEATFQP